MKHPFLVLALAACAFPVAAGPQETLRAAVEARFLGDRTGACIAAALVDDTTVTAIVSADPNHPRPLNEHTPFEIGSLSKTMATALLAEGFLKGDVTLDDPLAKLLPKGVKVPEFEGKPITLRQILSHRSGLPSLPSRLNPADESNPYASLTPEQLLGSLEDVTLESAPGTQYRYSNFAMMVLSYALAQRSGQDFQTLVTERIFKPLGMDDAHVVRKGEGEAQGHASNGRPAGAWDFPVDMAGVGGIRASLADMARYVEGELGRRQGPLTPALLLTQTPLVEDSQPPMAMNWMILPVGSRKIFFHEGGTGGFSSFVALDPARHRGIVLLSDTALGNLGGLAPLGFSILDPALPAPGLPRRLSPPGALLLDGMVGRFTLQNGMKMFITKKDGNLFAQAEGQPPRELGFDSIGDFYALEKDFVIHPLRTSQGYAFALRQGGGQMKAERSQPDPPTPESLKEYKGQYRVSKSFSVKVFARGGQLFVQGTDQPETAVDLVDKDVFAATGAEFTFNRDAAGKVTGLVLVQNGQSIKGEKR